MAVIISVFCSSNFLSSPFWKQLTFTCPAKTSGISFLLIFPHGATASSGRRPPVYQTSSSRSDTTHSVRPLWKSDQPDAGPLPLTTHNTHNRHTSMPPAVFELSIPASDWQQTHALDHDHII